MSTYWDVRCLDCDVESGLHLNHGAAQCRELVRARRALEALAGFNVCELELRVPGELGHVTAQFYADHADHVIAGVSEYGDIDGDCNESRPTGLHTTDGADCRLPEGHTGAHCFVLARPWSTEWEVVRRAAAARRREAE